MVKDVWDMIEDVREKGQLRRRVIKKKGSFVIIQTSEEDPFFFLDMGPYLVSREVRRELEIAITSTSDYLWYLVYDGDVLIAFAALEMGEPMLLRHAYVSPDYRENGLYKRLLDIRLSEAKRMNAKTVRVTAGPLTVEMFKESQFDLVKTRGKYKVYEKRLS